MAEKRKNKFLQNINKFVKVKIFHIKRNIYDKIKHLKLINNGNKQ